MKAESVYSSGTMSIIHNNRHHGIVIDLPEAKTGDDKGATALELVFMAVPGCVTTIFSMIANRKELHIEKMKCNIETIHEENNSLPYRVDGTLELIVNDPTLAEQVWKQTQNACPVVKLIKNAGIEINIETKITTVDMITV